MGEIINLPSVNRPIGAQVSQSEYDREMRALLGKQATAERMTAQPAPFALSSNAKLALGYLAAAWVIWWLSKRG